MNQQYWDQNQYDHQAAIQRQRYGQPVEAIQPEYYDMDEDDDFGDIDEHGEDGRGNNMQDEKTNHNVAYANPSHHENLGSRMKDISRPHDNSQ